MHGIVTMKLAFVGGKKLSLIAQLQGFFAKKARSFPLPCTSPSQCLSFEECGRLQRGSPDHEVADDDDDKGHTEANRPKDLLLTTPFMLGTHHKLDGEVFSLYLYIFTFSKVHVISKTP